VDMKHLLSVLTVLLAAGMTHAQFVNQAAAVPAFHPARPAAATKLPPILTEKQLADQGLIAPAQKEAYKAAARVSAVVYQMPCYCYCDRNHGHSSLRSCFESTHGASCSTCMQESLYSYRQSKKGWSAKMIRDGIVRGDFKMIDLQNVAPVQ
jgi:Protein of unknown function with PCYCGC motif